MAAKDLTDHKAVWTALAEALVGKAPGVRRGRMMSSDALTLGGKVFAFHTTTGRFAGLGLRLGRDFDVASLKLADWSYLAPFKSRPPPLDWIVVGPAHTDRWPALTRLALEQASRRT